MALLDHIFLISTRNKFFCRTSQNQIQNHSHDHRYMSYVEQKDSGIFLVRIMLNSANTKYISKINTVYSVTMTLTGFLAGTKSSCINNACVRLLIAVTQGSQVTAKQTFTSNHWAISIRNRWIISNSWHITDSTSGVGTKGVV